MKFHFSIEYRTNWGEEVKLVGSIPALGANNEEQAISLKTRDGRKWNLDIECPATSYHTITYYYLITKGNQVIRREWNDAQRTLCIPSNAEQTYIIEDAWRNTPNQRYFYSSAFQDIWLSRNTDPIPLAEYSKSILLKAYAPYLKPHEVLAICGNQEILGNWNPKKALVMSDHSLPEWQQAIDYAKLSSNVEYKFVILDKTTKELIAWESNSNRYLSYPTLKEDRHIVLADQFVNFATEQWRGAGVAVPVFSLRTQDSWGIGEFQDINKLVDWCTATGMKIIQVLPVNDTTQTLSWLDSYPYRCISVFALNPIYINLERLGILETPYKQEYLSNKEHLNTYKQVDFPYVQKQKIKYLQILYDDYGAKTLESQSFKEFYQVQKYWLNPYSVYCYLRDKFNTAETSCWEQYKTYNPLLVEQLTSPLNKDYNKIQYYWYVQYHLYTQLKAAHEYAKQNGIVLKGDLPIGISLKSVDAWMYPKLFNLNSQAGAPPDDFATHGQNWGFPTYNWKEMSKNNYAWWKDRLTYMSNFFEAYRIDHILGFFRIWSIPRQHILGIMGQFDPAIPLSIHEIEAKGLKFNKELYTQPYIQRQLLNKLFKKNSPKISRFFFKSIGNGLLGFKPAYNSQRKIRNFFQTSPSQEFDKSIETILLNLHSNVLFVEDNKEPNTYHPRIEGQKVAQYQLLSNKQKEVFNAIYNDFFYQRHNNFWKEQAYKKLPSLLNATSMLVCGEDLGMIPSSVPWVMQDLSILSLEITRMPKVAGNRIGDPNNYPYSSISSFSTHDMPTLRGWWQNCLENQRLTWEVLNLSQDLPALFTPEVAHMILQRELSGNSILSIQAIQDWLSLSDKWINSIEATEEQINTPSDSTNKWCYRIPHELEELIQDSKLTCTLKSLLKESHRL